MSATIELTQPELFGQDEHVCPGYDVCPIGICGCRFLGLGTPFASDVKKGTIYADTALHGNDDGLLLTHRQAITQAETNRKNIMETTRQEQAQEILNGKKFSFMGGTPKQNKLAKELFAERAAAAATTDMVFGKRGLTVEQGVDRVVDYFRHPADSKKMNSTQIITFFIGKF